MYVKVCGVWYVYMNHICEGGVPKLQMCLCVCAVCCCILAFADACGVCSHVACGVCAGMCRCVHRCVVCAGRWHVLRGGVC